MNRNQQHTFTEMHSYCRPMGSATEAAFIDKYIAPLPGATKDIYGNWHVIVGTSTILWSCHTDTVHHTEGRQKVYVNSAGYLKLSGKDKRRQSCLGADDTVGVFLLREMILAGVPGRYLFHYGEERGCIGSRALATGQWRESLGYYSCAIAFDRHGTTDIITHQSPGRTCSDAFALSLAAALNKDGLNFSPSNMGIYTDTVEYMDVVPECTNVACGYYNEHSADEKVDVLHVGDLLKTLLTFDGSGLVIERDPLATDLTDATDFTDWWKTVNLDNDGRTINDLTLDSDDDRAAEDAYIRAWDRDDDFGSRADCLDGTFYDVQQVLKRNQKTVDPIAAEWDRYMAENKRIAADRDRSWVN